MTATSERIRRMPRAERREQILDAASRAFARAGFAKTSLDAIAAEAAVTPVILYRHFESKADLYRAVLERAYIQLREATGPDDFDEASIPALVRAATANPDAFRLLFRYAARETEFHDTIDTFDASAIEITRRHLISRIADRQWRDWAAKLLPTLTTDAVVAWLDSGQPDPDQAPARIRWVVDAVVEAAQPDAIGNARGTTATTT